MVAVLYIVTQSSSWGRRVGVGSCRMFALYTPSKFMQPHSFEAVIQGVSGTWWSMNTKGNGEILIQAIVFRLAGSN